MTVKCIPKASILRPVQLLVWGGKPSCTQDIQEILSVSKTPSPGEKACLTVKHFPRDLHFQIATKKCPMSSSSSTSICKNISRYLASNLSIYWHVLQMYGPERSGNLELFAFGKTGWTRVRSRIFWKPSRYSLTVHQWPTRGYFHFVQAYWLVRMGHQI